MEAVKPLLDETQSILTVTDAIEMIGDRYYVCATASIQSTDNDSASISSRAYAREPLAQKGMSDPQCTGSASSYARKYALSGLLCLDDNKDPDTPTRGRKPKATQTSEVPDVELSKARAEIVTLAKSLMEAGIPKDSILEIIAKHNNGKKNSNTIPTVEKCNEVISILKGMK